MAGARIGEAHVLFLTGITAALSVELLEVMQAALDVAHGSGVGVYFDVNYRQPLWPADEAAAKLITIAQQGDVVFVGLDEANTLRNVTTTEQVRQLFGSWPGRIVVGPVGATELSADEVVFAPHQLSRSSERSGAGDAFAAGYLCAQFAHATTADRLRSGHRQAALALATTDDLSEKVPS